MELVTALFTTAVSGAGAAGAGLLDLVGLGGGAAAAEAGAAGTSAAAAATSTGVAWQGLQGTLTAGQMLMQGGAAVSSIIQGSMNATQAEIVAKQAALNIQRDYLIKTGAARVAFAGSGVTIGSGSEAGVEESLKSDEELQSQLALASGKAKANADMIGGIAGAVSAGAGILSTYGKYQISLANRGLPSS